MAGYTYYFLFSVMAVIFVPLAVLNATYTVRHNQSLLGQKIAKNTDGYRKFKKMSSGRIIFAASFLELLFVANLAYDVRRILHFDNKVYPHGILFFGPLAIIILLAIILGKMYTTFKSEK